MGRTLSERHRLSQQLRLEIKSPSFFRCPISLEVMRSPVSLSTGVTYDRSSIQRWLDSGNATCPATMLPLSSTDLVPNFTLRRLINIWSAAKSSKDDFTPADLIKDLTSSPDPSPLLEKLGDFFKDPEVDDAVKNGAISNKDFAGAVVAVLAKPKAIEIVAMILTSDWIEEKNKEIVLSSLCSDLDSTVGSLAAILRDRTEFELMLDSARILLAVLSASGSASRILASEKLDSLIRELIGLIGSRSAVDEALGCLIELLPSKRALKSMMKHELVPNLVKILSLEPAQVSIREAERAITVLEAAANCTAGRAAIVDNVEECVQVVMGRMMKVGKRGREAAVGFLWSICYSFGGDRRAKEIVLATNGGMAKILVVMQGDCSPAVRRMAGDLLRVFRVDAKSLVAGYDTKTTHIMPF